MDHVARLEVDGRRNIEYEWREGPGRLAGVDNDSIKGDSCTEKFDGARGIVIGKLDYSLYIGNFLRLVLGRNFGISVVTYSSIGKRVI